MNRRASGRSRGGVVSEQRRLGTDRGILDNLTRAMNPQNQSRESDRDMGAFGTEGAREIELRELSEADPRRRTSQMG
jgi:hypothetical protein